MVHRHMRMVRFIKRKLMQKLQMNILMAKLRNLNENEVHMKKNIHDTERAIRFLLGTILTSFAFIGPANPWFFLGIVPLLTGLVGNCPLYSALGMSTRKDDRHQRYLHRI